MNKTVEKFHALQLFTDTFAAETVHLTNEAIGIYIRLICFNWTKNTKPFTAQDAYRICFCRSAQCEQVVQLVLDEFFIKTDNKYTHKRLTAEHQYLTAKYKTKSENGKKGAENRWHTTANGKSMAPSPIPSPSPNNNIMASFESFWQSLRYKKGSKKYAFKVYKRECEELDPEELAKNFNRFAEKVQDKQFVPYVSSWINQRRFEDEITNKSEPIKIPDVVYNGSKLRKTGEFGHYEEYTDNKGNKYQKHKWKDEGIVKVD